MISKSYAIASTEITSCNIFWRTDQIMWGLISTKSLRRISFLLVWQNAGVMSLRNRWYSRAISSGSVFFKGWNKLIPSRMISSFSSWWTTNLGIMCFRNCLITLIRSCRMRFSTWSKSQTFRDGSSQITVIL